MLPPYFTPPLCGRRLFPLTPAYAAVSGRNSTPEIHFTRPEVFHQPTSLCICRSRDATGCASSPIIYNIYATYCSIVYKNTAVKKFHRPAPPLRLSICTASTFLQFTNLGFSSIIYTNKNRPTFSAGPAYSKCRFYKIHVAIPVLGRDAIPSLSRPFPPDIPRCSQDNRPSAASCTCDTRGKLRPCR